MSDHNPPPENQIPTLKFDHLEVFSALGRGSKGVVFLVRSDTKWLALKVILRESIEKKTKDEYKRISFEQEVLSRFNHPLFPRLHGVLSTEKVVGYAIDYCPGRDLNSLRKKQSEEMFSDEIIRFYAAELVIALEYLHSQGIVYRDLKPDNIMIQENGHLMLVDFDLSTNLPPRTPKYSPSSPRTPPATKKERFMFPIFGFCNSGISPDDSVSSEFDSSGEKSNSFVGTEEYVAPEVINGSGHDFAVDWWSLGVVLYEMLYGTTPFKGLNRKETFFKILSEPPSLVGEPTSLRDLVRKLLEKDPSRRINMEGIKGHDYFRELDWDLVLSVSRPPYIPAPENYEITKIDVEKFTGELFSNYERNGDNNRIMEANDRINNTSVENGMSSACKNIIAELNKGDKLEGDNYDIWYRKVQYVLEEQEVKETIFHLMEEPEQGTTAQHIRDQEAYNAWKRKNSIARITLLSCMQDDLMCEFEEYETAKGIWEALKEKFGATSATKVRRLNQKFNDYKKRPNQTMRQHLRVMSNMIRELKTAGQIMSDEQQVQAVLRSLPESWDHMKIQMTHNDNVKTFEDISRHLELEDERLEAARPFNEANYASSSSGVKRKRGNFGNKASEQANPKKQKRHAKRGKKGGKKDKTKMKCYNCDLLGHFARDCTEAKKTQEPQTT